MVFSFRMASFGRKSGVDSSEDKAFERTEMVLSRLRLVQVYVGSCGYLTLVWEDYETSHRSRHGTRTHVAQNLSVRKVECDRTE